MKRDPWGGASAPPCNTAVYTRELHRRRGQLARKFRLQAPSPSMHRPAAEPWRKATGSQQTFNE